MTTPIDLYGSFRSSWSYRAVPGAQRLEGDVDVKVHLRPVLPLAVRDPVFFSPDNLKRAQPRGVDSPRGAETLGVPTFAFEGEPFFGEDRIDLLRWRLRRRVPARTGGAA